MILGTAVLHDALVAWEWAVLVYFVTVNSFYAVLLGSAAWELRVHAWKVWHERRERLLASEIAPVVSILAPAYNEATTIEQSVRALLTLRYPRLEVVVVNDGSPDDTLGVLQREFALAPMHPVYRRRAPHEPVRGLYRSTVTPQLLVVDKENGGKADALNAALNVATGSLVCAIDADTLIEPDALLRIVRPFLERDDVVATGGTIRVANGSSVRAGRVVAARAPRHALPGIQTVEYLRAFLFGRLGWNRLGGNLIISGAFGLFDREAVLAAGGYLRDTVGEDMELVANLRRRGLEGGGPHRVLLIPDPVAWTEVPESVRVLGRQRDRWQRGLADVIWRYRGMLLRPHFGALGFVALPYFLLVELVSPVVEAAGLAGLALALLLGAVDWSFAALFFLAAYGYGLILTCAALALEEFGARRYEHVGDRAVLLGWGLLETLGYRQLGVVWRLRGLAGFLRGRREWGAMTRSGFGPEDG